MTKNFDPELERRARDALSGVYAPAPAGGDIPLSFHRVLAAMFRSRYVVFSTALLGFLGGAVAAVISPNTYSSTGKFMFTGVGSENVAVGPTSNAGPSNEGISQNATYLLTSNDLLIRVVDALTPEKILQPYFPGSEGGAWYTSLFHSLQREYSRTANKPPVKEDALVALQKAIAVERPRFSNVLIVSCLANSAALAQEILDVYMREAVQWHLEKYDDPRVYEEASGRAEAAERSLEEVRNRLEAFLEEHQVRDFELELRSAREQVLAQGRLLDEKHGLIESASKQVSELQRRLSGMQRTRQVLQKPNSSMWVDLYLRKISELELKRTSKSSLLRSDSPELVELDNQIGALKQSLADAQKLAGEEKEVAITEPNPEWDVTNNELLRLSLEAAKLKFDAEALAPRYESTKALADKLNALEFDYNELKRQEARLEEDRKLASEALDSAVRRRQLKLGSLSLLQTIESASLPVEKEGPNRAKLVLGGLLAGLFLGIGVVLTRAVADSTVRDREDLERLDAIDVIGVLPRLDARNLRRHRALREQGW